MDLDEESRRIVHDWAAESGGPEVAAALMANLSPVPPSELATKTGLERLGSELRVEMAGVKIEMVELGSELRGEMHQLGSELRVEMAGVKIEMAAVKVEMVELGSELRGEMAGVKIEMAGMRGEITELRGEVKGQIGELRGEIKAQLPRLYAANLVGMIGVAALVLGAVRLG